MRSLVAVVGLLLLALASPGAVEAQGLGDVATKEKKRRTASPQEPAQVFTNADLPEREPPSDETDDAEGEDGEAEAADLDKVGAIDPLREEMDREREERELAEREWRARFAEARARFRAAEARGWREVVRTEFYNGIPVQMKVQEFVETEEYRRTKQELADLEEEFRRTGLPPGWARE